MSAQGALKTVRRRMLGVALLVVIALFLSLTVASYQKAFRSTVDVTLQAGSSANQLLPNSDVKVRGMIIGEVRDIATNGDGAEMQLAIEPDKAEMIPSNVSARLLPKTLFGERYVSLELPQNAGADNIASGDVIQQDRSKASIELEKVLADTMPVLQAVQPDDLAATLNALSQALEGRGKPLGETLSQLNTYLEGFNPSVPQLQENLQQLVGFAETYEQAAPDLLNALENFSTTSRTMVEQRDNLATLNSQLTTTSNDMTAFLEANGDNIIRLGEQSRPNLDLLAKYSPSYPCFLGEMAEFVPRVNEVFGKGTNEPGLHITLEVNQNRGKYEPNQDEPEFNDKRGPRCYPHDQLPSPFPQYPPESDGGPIQDGSTPPPSRNTVEGPSGKPPNTGGEAQTSGPQSTSPQGTGSGLGVVNSPAERDFVSALLAPTMGVPANEVPEWGSLLVGPVLRGAEVSYR
ncbi:MCE family protein [Allosaccharopolyspora coralli]|uniref:MCE family protein n=1 Tax=Allosaccharopolyspora coralli TaxID=2665642 RepID=A0A5Q3QA66_9PSEU|nr:MCE family protein [Allosaccharopolyspora coralli]QGK71551.1 MCE family protein [Allosaccharopolyspora coralli]